MAQSWVAQTGFACADRECPAWIHMHGLLPRRTDLTVGRVWHARPALVVELAADLVRRGVEGTHVRRADRVIRGGRRHSYTEANCGNTRSCDAQSYPCEAAHGGPFWWADVRTNTSSARTLRRATGARSKSRSRPSAKPTSCPHPGPQYTRIPVPARSSRPLPGTSCRRHWPPYCRSRTARRSRYRLHGGPAPARLP